MALVMKNSKHSIDDTRRALARAFWGIAKFYEFSRQEQAGLLLMSKTNRAPIKKFQDDESIPNNESVEIIVSQLLGIHKNLSILYPRADEIEGNYQLKKSWFHRPLRELEGKVPIEFILEDDRPIAKITVLRRFLDIKRTSH